MVFLSSSREDMTHAVTAYDFQKSVWVSLETSVQSCAWGPPFSLLFCLALLCSAFLNTQGSFFLVIVPADECLTVPSSGGFETG